MKKNKNTKIKYEKKFDVDNLSFVKVDSRNIKKAISIQSDLFVNESGIRDLYESIGKRPSSFSFLTYFIIKQKSTPIGIIGFYCYDIYPKDMWLGWFGILEKYYSVKKGLIAMNFAKYYSEQLGYDALRVNTDEISDAPTNAIFEAFNMKKEVYSRENGKIYQVGKMLIYSIPLNNNKLALWENRNLYLQEHEIRNTYDGQIIDDINIKKFRYIPLSKENLDLANSIQKRLYPLESAEVDYDDSLKLESGKIKTTQQKFNYCKYFLIQYQEKFIGITGLYSHEQYPEDAWLGWYGLLSEYRKNDVCIAVIQQMFNFAMKQGYKHFRVYADSVVDSFHCELYEQIFDYKENYDLENGKYYLVGQMLVYSKSLTNKKVVPWDNKCLFLEKHEKVNNRYKLKFVKITKENVKLAGVIQYKIFNVSHEVGYVKYLKYLKDEKKKNLPIHISYLVYFKNKPIGVIGLYEEDYKTKDEVWVDWFGVLPEYRKHGFGTQMFLEVINQAQQMGKKILRLVTYSKWNVKAQGIYKRTMKKEEYYNNVQEDQYYIRQGKPKIFSLNLTDTNLTSWGNQYLDISYDVELNVKSIARLKREKLI